MNCIVSLCSLLLPLITTTCFAKNIQGIARHQKLKFTCDYSDVVTLQSGRYEQLLALFSSCDRTEMINISMYDVPISMTQNMSIVLMIEPDTNITPANAFLEVYDTPYKLRVEPFYIADDTIYKGIVVDMETGLKSMGEVYGYITRNWLFLGVIQVQDTIFHIESAAKYGIKEPGVNAVMYQRDHVNFGDLIRQTDPLTEAQDEKENIPYDRENTPRYCDIEVVMHTSFQLHKLVTEGSIDEAVKTIMLYLRRADEVFRSMDLNEDGHPDNIGVKPTKFMLYHEEQPALLRSSSVEAYLEKFSIRNTSEIVCLTMVFVCVNFSDGIGGAYLGKLDLDSEDDSGICALSRDDNGVLRRKNINIVTCMEDGVVLPDPVMEVTVIHQLGHSFGGPHDDMDDPLCTRERQPYVMAAEIKDGSQSFHSLFSPCSQRYIGFVIEQKGFCFRPNLSPKVVHLKEKPKPNLLQGGSWLYYALILYSVLLFCGLVTGAYVQIHKRNKNKRWNKRLSDAEKIILEHLPECSEDVGTDSFTYLCRLTAMFPYADIKMLKLLVDTKISEENAISYLVSKGYQIQKP